LNDWQALLQSGHMQPSKMALTDKDLAQIPYKVSHSSQKGQGWQ
jgi:hypothetical protein